MNLLEAMEERHSVRQYMDKPIEKEIIEILSEEINKINKENGLHIQLVANEPKAFQGTMAHYGNFSGVKNYFAMVGPKDSAESIGYYGEQLVLLAQKLGLNTCWVGLTFSKIKDAYTVNSGEKLHIVIALGYGENQGKAHKSKDIGKIAKDYENAPLWFKSGVNAALLAPTAINQQKFVFELNANTVTVKALRGPYSKLDLGIVKFHFEIGAGKDNFQWG